MQYFGDIGFSKPGVGQIKNMVFEKKTNAEIMALSGVELVAGRILYDTTNNVCMFYNGVSWVAVSTGGDAAALLTEVNSLETTLGSFVATDGTFNSATADTALATVTSPTSFSNILQQMDSYIMAHNAITEMTDVTITALAVGDMLVWSGTAWVDKSLSEAGIQPADPALTALSNVSGTGVLVQTAADTFSTRSVSASVAAGHEGVSVVNGNGVSGNMTVGFNMAGLTSYSVAPSTSDTLVLFDGTNNKKSTVTLLKDSIVSAGITLDNLSNVNDSAATTTGLNYMLSATAANTYTVGKLTLGALNNVADGVDTAATGTYLTYNGSQWTSVTVADLLATAYLNDLGDVVITTAISGNVLYYNGTNWVNSSPASAGVQPLDADLTAVAALSSTGIAVRTAADTWALRSVSGTAGTVVVSNGDGVSGNPTVTLATVTDSGTGSFKKLATDSYGRVTGTTNVVVSDITSLVDGTYVNVSGDSMTGNLVMSSGTDVVLPDMPVNATDAANKAYVDQVVTSSLTWRLPITDPDLVGISATEPVSPVTSTGYIATAAGTWGSTSVAAGDYVNWNGTTWTVVAPVVAGTRFLIAVEHGVATTSLTSIGFAKGDLIQYVSGSLTSGSSWSQPEGKVGPGTPEIPAGTTVMVSDPDSSHYGHTYTYNTQDNVWFEVSGPGAIGAGVGLYYSGTIMNIALGAGIVELPSDEVGLDVASGKAVQLTNNTTGGQLTFVLDGSTMSQSASGLKISAGGVTGVELNASVAGDGVSLVSNALHVDYVTGSGLTMTANQLDLQSVPVSRLAASTIVFDADTGVADPVTLGETLTVTGNNGISTDNTSNNVLTISGVNATTTTKGVASFNSASFSVSSGDVTIKSGGVTNAQLVYSSISLAGGTGTGSVSLGSTLTIAAGTGISTSVSGSTATVTLNAATSNLTDVSGAGSVGKTLVHDGSQYVPSKIQFVYSSAAAATSHTVTHNLGQKYCSVIVVNTSDEVIMPNSITYNTNNQLTVTFNESIDCKVIVMGVVGISLN